MQREHFSHIGSTSRSSTCLAPGALDVFVAGLGGMGVVGLTRRIGTLLRTRGGSVYTKESRGFGQRRAIVTGAVRAGHQVKSPELVAGANVLLALEACEALRHERILRPGALVVVCDTCIAPIGVSGREFKPIDTTLVEARLGRRGARVFPLPVARWLAQRALPSAYASSAMLGAFSALAGLDLGKIETLLGDTWRPGERAANLAVCGLGHDHVATLLEPNAQLTIMREAA